MKQFTSLKGLLALMIFVHHLNLYDGGGSLAVCLFFMIGGFLSTIGYHQRIFETDWNYKNYMLGKCIKFYPLHWILTLATIPFALLPILLHGATNLLASLGLFALNASLLHSLIPLKEVYFSYNFVSWYLSDTLIFVALFPFILRWLMGATKNVKILAGTFALCLYVLLWIFLPSEYTHAVFYINPFVRLLDYVIGIQCGLLFLSHKAFLLKHAEQSRIFRFTGIISFALLVCISLVSLELSFHSVIYILPAGIFILSVATNGGGYFANSTITTVRFDLFCLLSKSSGGAQVSASVVEKG